MEVEAVKDNPEYLIEHNTQLKRDMIAIIEKIINKEAVQQGETCNNQESNGETTSHMENLVQQENAKTLVEASFGKVLQAEEKIGELKDKSLDEEHTISNVPT
ncbi:hypothetical protein HAX54_047266 [Datura stramonium]|uniref:Uncharacterized protein n=1 Tax=Datura stramonium TaxID=4076 RepID=A0ABS8RQM8_DATST|nr:hypothetical protein [Datura stramonium]